MSFDQKVKTAFALQAKELPDSIFKTETTVTMIFKRYNSKITFPKRYYENYCILSLERHVKVGEKVSPKPTW